jgi:choline dehydrogenase-like flavoprotein
VLAAGSLHSPALLLRSGINHPGIGANLFFHPTVAVAGFYKEDIAPWYGPMMSVVDRGGMRLDGNFGHWIETPPVHAGMAGLALPWEGPAQHRRDMERVGHMSTFIVLTRDKFGGRVRLDRQGQPLVSYQLSAYDRAHMIDGIRQAFELHRAAGAQDVVFPHFRHSRYNIATSKMSATHYLARMPKWGWQPNRFALFTAHQMGTCAMGSDSKRHPFNPQGECYSLPGLFVADGSAMPTCAGVNPMVSIMALAGWVARGMV